MNIKDYIILVIFSLGLGWFLVESKPTYKHTPTTDALALGEAAIKAHIEAQIDTPTTFSVANQTALFIGDSHTSNRAQGWQTQLSKAVGFNMINPSVGGKTTYWMLEIAHLKLNNKIDYCFVYGGANDMYSSHITPQEAVDNIKGIARMCTGLGVKCVVLTGFDPVKCTRTSNVKYAGKYSKFQELLLSEYMDGAQVIDTRVVARTDCWDGLCHMAPSGHKKIAEKVIKDLAFQRI